MGDVGLWAVSVVVMGAGPVTLMVAGMLQVMGVVAPVGAAVTAQGRLMVPVKPLDELTLIVDVLPVVAPRLSVMLPPLLSEKCGGD